MASIGQDNQDKDIMLNHVKKYAFAYFNEKVLALYDEVSEFINENDPTQSSDSDDENDNSTIKYYHKDDKEFFDKIYKYLLENDGIQEINNEELYKHYSEIFISLNKRLEDLKKYLEGSKEDMDLPPVEDTVKMIEYYNINYLEPLIYFKKYLETVKSFDIDNLFNINKICELSLDKFPNDTKQNGVLLDIKKATLFLRNPGNYEAEKEILRNIWLLLIEYFDYLEGKMGYKISMYEPYVINRLYISEILISESIFYANSLTFKKRVGEVNRELLKQLEKVKEHHKKEKKIFTITDKPDLNGNWWTLTDLNTDKKTSVEEDDSSQKLDLVQSPLRALEQSPLRAMKTIRRYPKNAEDCLDVKSGILEDSDLSVISQTGKELIDDYDNAICKLQEERKNQFDLLLEAIENGNKEQQEKIKGQLKDNINIYKTKNEKFLDEMDKLSSNSMQELEDVKNKIKEDVKKDELEITVEKISAFLKKNPKLFQRKITDYFNTLKKEKKGESILTRQWSIKGKSSLRAKLVEATRGKSSKKYKITRYGEQGESDESGASSSSRGGGKKTKKKRKRRKKTKRRKKRRKKKRKKSKKRKKRRKKRKTRKY